MLDAKTANWIRVQQNRFSRREQSKSHHEEKLEKYDKKLVSISKFERSNARYLSETRKEKDATRKAHLDYKKQDQSKKDADGLHAYVGMKGKLKEKSMEYFQLQKTPYQDLPVHLSST